MVLPSSGHPVCGAPSPYQGHICSISIRSICLPVSPVFCLFGSVYHCVCPMFWCGLLWSVSVSLSCDYLSYSIWYIVTFVFRLTLSLFLSLREMYRTNVRFSVYGYFWSAVSLSLRYVFRPPLSLIPLSFPFVALNVPLSVFLLSCLRAHFSLTISFLLYSAFTFF